jgi:hypothetical protein
MPTRLKRLVVLVLPVALWHTPLAAQVSGAWSRCNMDSLATWNCAMYYSGTVTLSSELKGPGVNDVSSVTATVAAGKVTCRMKSTDTGEYEVPGMLTVEHASTENSGEYEIRVWCPDAAGKRPSRRDYPVIEIMDQKAADYTTLAGKDSYEHPDADEVNGIAGTQTVTWNLKRR